MSHTNFCEASGETNVYPDFPLKTSFNLQIPGKKQFWDGTFDSTNTLGRVDFPMSIFVLDLIESLGF